MMRLMLNRIFDKTAKVQGMAQFANFHRAMSQLAAGKFDQAQKTFDLIHSDQAIQREDPLFTIQNYCYLRANLKKHSNY